MTDVFFFLSYSRQNAGAELERFYADLVDELQGQIDFDGSSIGFKDDANIPLAKRWEGELSAALQSCRAFVAVCSPSYFTRDYCGKEWHAFRHRFEGRTRVAPAPLDLIFPVLWHKPDASWFPPVASEIQYRHPEMPPEYEARGLRYLLRNADRFEEAYRDVLFFLAQGIADAVRECELAPHPTTFDFGKLANAFREDTTADERRERGVRGELRDYLLRLWGELNTLPLHVMLDRSADDVGEVHLSDVYTAMNVTATFASLTGTVGEALRLEEGYHANLSRRVKHHRPLTATEAAAGVRHLVLMGAPGSGKTTFVKHLALALAGQLLGEKESNLKSLNAEGTGEAWPHGAPVPVFVELASFVRSDTFPDVGERGKASDLVDFIAAREPAPVVEKLKASFADGDAVLLLDGLDETPSSSDVRAGLKHVIESFARAYKKCRIVVTSRPYAYGAVRIGARSQSWRLKGFQETELAPLEDDAIERFLKAWYGQLARRGVLGVEQAAALAETVLQELHTVAFLRALVERPLMLTIVADVAASRGGSLKGGRAGLYEKSAQLLLNRWNVAKKQLGARRGTDEFGIGNEDLRRALEELAFRVHDERGSSEMDGPAQIEVGKIWEVLNTYRTSDEPMALSEVTDYLNQRSGILVGDSSTLYRFPHRSYQEFLAACYLLRERFPDWIVEKLTEDFALWREVFLLAAARVKANLDATHMTWLLLEAALPVDPPDELARTGTCFEMAVLCGTAVLENRLFEKVQQQHRGKLERVRAWLVRTLEVGAMAPPRRAEGGRVLGEIGDPRKGVGLGGDGLPDIDWVEIPAGRFWMGVKKESLDLPKFRIGRYPITNSQYSAFVDDGGYTASEFWSDEGSAWRESERIDAPEHVWEIRNHPRVGVSWYEAEAFCRWLSTKLGLEVRLPSNAEWEKAARGYDGREYPWGNDFDAALCNNRRAQINMTSAVGAFPDGMSVFGVLDMAGNVFEWCADLDEETQVHSHVLRGGAWYAVDPDDFRCALHHGNDPGNRYHYVGFRVSSSVPL